MDPRPARRSRLLGDEDSTRAHFGVALAGAEDGGAGFLRTGDLGLLFRDEVFHVGRIKDLIVRDGRNIAPQDVEWSVECSHPALRPGGSTAFSLDDGEREQLVVVAELRRTWDHGDDDECAALLEAVTRAVLADVGIALDRLVLLEARCLPKTSSGKLRRRATRESWLAGTLDVVRELGAGAAHAETQEANQALRWQLATLPPAQRLHALLPVVAREITRVLGTSEGFDPDRPLAELGLESQQAVLLSTRLTDLTGAALEPARIFDHPTARALARHLLQDVFGLEPFDPSVGRADDTGVREHLTRVSLPALRRSGLLPGLLALPLDESTEPVATPGQPLDGLSVEDLADVALRLFEKDKAAS